MTSGTTHQTLRERWLRKFQPATGTSSPNPRPAWRRTALRAVAYAATSATLGMTMLGTATAASADTTLINPDGVALTQTFSPNLGSWTVPGDTCNYNCGLFEKLPGGEQQFTVPSDLVGGKLTVTAVGAAGGDGSTAAPYGVTTDVVAGTTGLFLGGYQACASAPGHGGQGAQVTGTIAAQPGQKLYVEVGTPGNDFPHEPGQANPYSPGAAGWNGGGAGGVGQASSSNGEGDYGCVGGGGGGSSDVRTCSISDPNCPAPGSPADPRLIVAAGGAGGGGGGHAANEPGWDGGAAGAAGGGDGIFAEAGTAGAYSDGTGGNGGYNEWSPSGSGGNGGGGGGYAGGGGGGGLPIGGGAGGGGGSNLVPADGAASLTSQPSQVQISYTVEDKFASAATATLTAGQAGSFTVQVAGQPASIAASGALPDGVAFTDNGDNTATFSGTPQELVQTSDGIFPITITATNDSGHSITQSFTLYIRQLVRFTQAPAQNVTCTIGAVCTGEFDVASTPTDADFTIGADSDDSEMAGKVPCPELDPNADPDATADALFCGWTPVPNLPDGMGWIPGVDRLGFGGIPAAGTAGTYGYVIGAESEDFTSGAAKALSLTIVNPAAPAITSADHAALAVGQAGSFTVKSTGAPVANLTESGTLPPGVSFADNGDGTATLAGSPPAGADGSYPITITADNGDKKPATQTLTLTVSEACAGTCSWTATQKFSPGSIFTDSQGNELTMQTDGNLVIYNSSHAATWSSGTYGNPGAYAQFQSDGNLVVYTASGGFLWNSATAGGIAPGGTLAFDKGTLTISNAAGVAVWANGKLLI